MLIFYLLALIIGGGLLIFSLFAGNSTDEFSTDVNSIHTDTIDSDSLDSGIHLNHHTESPSKSSGIDAVKLLSFRNAVYFLSFLGLTGSILSFLSSSEIVTVLSSIVMGFSSTIIGHNLMKYLVKTQTGEGLNIHQLIGKTAKVTIPVKIGGRGKILVYYSDQTIELNAEVSTSSNKKSFTVKDNVIIAEISNNTAYIVESDLLLHI